MTGDHRRRGGTTRRRAGLAAAASRAHGTSASRRRMAAAAARLPVERREEVETGERVSDRGSGNGEELGANSIFGLSFFSFPNWAYL